LATYLLVNIGAAQPGTLDANFGVGGIVGRSFKFPSEKWYEGHAVLEAPNGKILTVGNASNNGVIAQFYTNGATDTLSNINYWGFFLAGGALFFDGYTHFQLGHVENPIFNAVAVQPDGKIVIVGKILYESSNQRYILFRQNEDGSFDPTFGGYGIGYTVGPVGTPGHSVAIRPDGKILVGNNSSIVRHLANGLIDSTFATNGVALINSSPTNCVARTMLLQPDGKIVVAGNSAPSPFRPSLARFNPNGTLDIGFGNNGYFVENFTGAYNSIESLLNGQLLAIGTSSDKLVVARFNNGQLDMSYGENGVALVEIAGKFLIGTSSALQTDGKLLVAGYAGTQDMVADDYLLARFTTEGLLDDSFGDGGLVITDLSPKSDRLLDVAMQQDGKIIVTGYAGKEYPANGWGTEYIVARYLSGLEVGTTEKPAIPNKLMVHPNPASDFLNFQLHGQAPSSEAVFRIINLDGRVLETVMAAAPQSSFSLPSDWATGMYFLQYLEGNEVKAVEKFIITKK